jgi:hypothetical protein
MHAWYLLALDASDFVNLPALFLYVSTTAAPHDAEDDSGGGCDDKNCNCECSSISTFIVNMTWKVIKPPPKHSGQKMGLGFEDFQWKPTAAEMEAAAAAANDDGEGSGDGSDYEPCRVRRARIVPWNVALRVALAKHGSMQQLIGE